jgi:hypothetical protein
MRAPGDEDTGRRRRRTKTAARLSGALPEPEGADAGSSPPPPLPSPTEQRIGISCSGGGIRSAAYNLGALQVLQEAGVLGRARYLSAVSGGSYIAGSFTMVARYSDPELLDEQAPYAPGSPEEEYLRNRSSYLASGLRGKARLAIRFLLGVAINLLVVAAVLVAIGRPLGWLAAWVRPELLVVAGDPPAAPDLSAPVTVMWLLLAAGLSLALLAVVRSYAGSWQHRIAWLAGASAVLGGLLWLSLVGLPFAVTWLRGLMAAPLQLLSTSTEVGDPAWQQNYGALDSLLRTLGALGIPALVAGVARMWVESNRSKVAIIVGAVFAPLALVAALLAVVNTAAARGLVDPVLDAVRWSELTWLGGALALLAVLYAISDLTAWSLHPFYRRRLASAFALKRVRAPDGEPTAVEHPYDELVTLSDAQPRDRDWPELLICAAANLSDEGATPPGRGATTFTFSPTSVGGPLVGYVDTETFETALGPGRRRDITLPAAIAVSGAAISPSMGRMSRPSLRFLLTLANARLGVWLPNPRGVRSEDVHDSGGGDAWGSRPRLSWLVREMFGLNRLNARFLYVTDGGHYENLGLIELLRRECTEIYCFDASGDQVDTFFTLGLAVALARSELGVEIDIDPSVITEDGADWCETDHVIGEIRYRNGATGTLLFAKAGVTRDAPWDVRAYNQKDPDFPTHATTDQLYTDEKFEAYRALGRHTAARALRSMAARHTQPVTASGSPAAAETAPGSAAAAGTASGSAETAVTATTVAPPAPAAGPPRAPAATEPVVGGTVRQDPVPSPPAPPPRGA